MPDKNDWKTVSMIMDRPNQIGSNPGISNQITEFAREYASKRKRTAAGVSSILDFGGPSGSSIPSVLAQNSAISSLLYTMSRADKLQLFRYFCFTDPHTPITMEDGTEKSICEIKEGDRVINALGSVTTVSKPLVREYDGEVVDLDLTGRGERLIGVTPEHPFWVVKGSKVGRSYTRVKKPSNPCGTTTETKIHIDFSPEWLEAGDIEDGDFLVVPKTSGVFNDDFSVAKVRLLGYYLAEGNPTYKTLANGSETVAINWQFCSSEDDLINEVVGLVESLTGEAPSVHGPYDSKSGDTVGVRTHTGNSRHVRLAEWILHHGGRYSHSKKLSKEVFYLEDELVKHLMACWLNGDGSQHLDSDQVSGTSVSFNLIHQMFLIATRIGMAPGKYYCDRKGESRDAAILQIPPYSYNVIAGYAKWVKIRKKFRHRKYNVDGNMLFPVKCVTRRKFTGKVYNIETNGKTYDEQSFLVHGFGTHNCRHDPMVGRAIDLHTELPMSRITIGPPKGPSPRQNKEITRIYESMSDDIDLMSLMLDIPRELWIVGDTFIWCHWDAELLTVDEAYVLPAEYMHSIIHPFNRKKEIVFFAKPLVDTAAIRRITDRDLYLVADTDIERLYESLGDSIPEELKEALNYGEAVPLNTNWRRGSFCVHIARDRPPNEEYGTCVHEDTFVLNNSGYFQIKDLIGSTTNIIQTEYGPKSYLRVQCNGIQDLLKVTTNTNREIKITPTHRFRVMGKDGILHWRHARDLNPGDYLLCQRGDCGMIPEDRGESPDLWEALGLMWGDGCRLNQSSRYTLVVPEGEEETLEWFKNWLEQEGYKDISEYVLPEGRERIRSYREDMVYRVKVREPVSNLLIKTSRSLNIVDFYHPGIEILLPPFEDHGEWRSNGFPPDFWKSGKKQMGAFLRGLFTTDGSCGDGSPNRRVVSFVTVHKKVAEDVQRALLLLGVVCQIDTWVDESNALKKGGLHVRYVVRLLGFKSMRNFLKNVGFRLSRKQDNLISCCNPPAKGQRTYYGYPHSTELIKKIFPQPLSSNRYREGDDVKLDSTVAVIRSLKSGRSHLLADTMIEKVLEKASVLGQDKYAEALLQEYVNNDWWFDKVKSVEEIDPEPVYDPLNSESSSYISEGIVSHNSLIERNMDTLLRLENLKNANFQISSRNMAPKYVVSAPGAGKEALAELRTQFDLALLETVDYVIMSNYEINVQVLGANDRLLNTESEYNILRQDLAMGLGSTVDMLTGASTYGGQRITLETMNTQYLRLRDNMKTFVEKSLFLPVAFAKGHYMEEEIEMWPRVKPEDTEVGDILIEERNGHLRRKRTQINTIWMYSTLRFNRVSIRDNAEVYDQLFQLYQKGSLAVRYLLDLHNIDSEENSQALLEDLGTPKDSVFNDFTRALYTSTDVPQKVVNQTDFIDRIIQGMKLTRKMQPPTGAAGVGMGGGMGGGMSDMGGLGGGGMGGGMPGGMPGDMGLGGPEGVPGEVPGAEGAGVPPGAPGAPGVAPGAEAPPPTASRRQAARKAQEALPAPLPGRVLDPDVAEKLRKVVSSKYDSGVDLSPRDIKREIQKIESEKRKVSPGSNGAGSKRVFERK